MAYSHRTGFEARLVAATMLLCASHLSLAESPIVVTQPPPTFPCQGVPTPLSVIHDEPGNGEAATKASAVLMRAVVWNYVPNASNPRGTIKGILPQANDLGFMTTHRARVAGMMDFIVDAMLPTADSAAMRVGGKRSIVIACNKQVIDIELFEVAASPSALKLKTSDIPPLSRSVLAAKEARITTVKEEMTRRVQPLADRTPGSLPAETQQTEGPAAREDKAALIKRYQSLVENARSERNVDPVVFGIVLGAPWRNLQDIEDDHRWDESDTMPFGVDYHKDTPTALDRAQGPRFRAYLNYNKFDTDWIRDNYVVVSTLNNGAVGSIDIKTYVYDLEKPLEILREKYGNNFTSQRVEWQFSNPTYRYTWVFKDFSIVYDQIYKDLTHDLRCNDDGCGRVLFFTPAWTAESKAAERSKRRL